MSIGALPASIERWAKKKRPRQNSTKQAISPSRQTTRSSRRLRKETRIPRKARQRLRRPPTSSSFGLRLDFPRVLQREQLSQRLLGADMPRLDVLYFIRRLYVGRHRDKAVKTARVQAAIVIRCAAVHWVPVFEVFIFEDFSIL